MQESLEFYTEGVTQPFGKEPNFMWQKIEHICDDGLSTLRDNF